MEYLPPIPYTMVKRRHSHFRLANLYPSPANLVVSNVPGPHEPLYWNGALLVEFYSVGPLSEGIGLNLTVWSYCDRIYCALLEAAAERAGVVSESQTERSSRVLHRA